MASPMRRGRSLPARVAGAFASSLATSSGRRVGRAALSGALRPPAFCGVGRLGPRGASASGSATNLSGSHGSGRRPRPGRACCPALAPSVVAGRLSSRAPCRATLPHPGRAVGSGARGARLGAVSPLRVVSPRGVPVPLAPRSRGGPARRAGVPRADAGGRPWPRPRAGSRPLLVSAVRRPLPSAGGREPRAGGGFPLGAPDRSLRASADPFGADPFGGSWRVLRLAGAALRVCPRCGAARWPPPRLGAPSFPRVPLVPRPLGPGSDGDDGRGGTRLDGSDAWCWARSPSVRCRVDAQRPPARTGGLHIRSIPAATYSPRESPPKYHRRWRA